MTDPANGELLQQLTKLLATDEESQRRLETAQTPLPQLFEEFQAALIARNVTHPHAVQTIGKCRRIAESIHATRIGHLTPSRIEKAVEMQTNAGGTSNDGLPLSNASKNHFFRALHNFFAWLRRDGRITENPLTGRLRTYRLKGYETRKRRIISEAELANLIEVTEYGPAWQGPRGERMTGPTRADLYRTAVATGLRARELRSLSVGQAILFGDDCGIRILAQQSKNREEAFQRIPRELAERLRRLVDGRQAQERLFPKVTRFTAKMLRYDLNRAGIAYKTEKGVFDFHCLRKMTAAILAARNVPPKIIQKIMRHSTIELSMSLYADAQTDDLVAARDTMPSFLPGTGGAPITPAAPAPAATPQKPLPAMPGADERTPLPSEPGVTTIPPVKVFKPAGRNSNDEVWWVRYWTPSQRMLEEPVSTSRALTEEYARELWERLERRRMGIMPEVEHRKPRKPDAPPKPDPNEDRPRHRLHDRLRDFETSLIRQGLPSETAKYHAYRCRRILWKLAELDPETPITRESIRSAIDGLDDEQTGDALGRSTHRNYWKSFIRFLGFVGEPLPELRARHALHDRLGEFHVYLASRGLSRERVLDYVNHCRNLLSSMAEVAGPDAGLSTAEDVIESLHAKGTDQPLSGESKRKYRRLIRTFFGMINQQAANPMTPVDGEISCP